MLPYKALWSRPQVRNSKSVGVERWVAGLMRAAGKSRAVQLARDYGGSGSERSVIEWVGRQGSGGPVASGGEAGDLRSGRRYSEEAGE